MSYARNRPHREFDLSYFDPSEMSDGSVVLLVGRRGSGKSTLAADLMSYRLECKRGLCISGTETKNPFWGEYIPSCFIHSEWDPGLVETLFEDQEKVKKWKGAMQPTFGVFDDLMFNKDFVKSPVIREVFMNGRHSKLFTLVTAQWLMDVPASLRANVDYVFVLKDNVRANRERVYTQFGGMFDDMYTFDSVMKQLTEDHHCMVLRNKSLSYNVSDCVSFYKATPDLKYKLCAPEYWRYSERQKLKEKDGEQAGQKQTKRVRVNKVYRPAPPMAASADSDDDDAPLSYADRYRSLRAASST